ncbi:helix-turn-helix domain-containing protein [Nitrosarchaeum sp.]|uniref:TrmB family transcriptional regulator n=1 Tax=Nitrosarchaeum sp. TaxID=2026886 RepID=UPI00247BE50D|nr:helix-turn-helix domain-containing protein [Nitrosarchaeum sp.]MCV0411554.1 TrmB family transcriptional regulator [Nitrosarchaeum sp.]
MTIETQTSIFDSTPDTQLYEYKLSIDKVQSELLQYGLTSNQSKVFIYLGKYGAKTAPEVCKALKLPRTETYHLLSALQNKGIVSATFQHPIQFTASPLNKAIWILVNAEKERVKSLEHMEKGLSELWDNIPTFDSLHDEVEEKFQMLQGANQIQSKITEMTDNFKDEFLILGSEKDYIKLYHGEFLESFVKSKQQFRLLSACSDKTTYIFDNLERKNIKKLDKDIQNHLCFILKDDSELLFFTKNANSTTEPFAMWTNSKSLVYSMKLLFESLWTNSKNIHL